MIRPPSPLRGYGATSLRWLAEPKLTVRLGVSEGWQVRRDSNPQPSVLETDALPIELLTCAWRSYFVSLCAVCLRQKRQYFANSSRSVVFFLFFVVL